jgi:hypothetical protein
MRIVDDLDMDDDVDMDDVDDEGVGKWDGTRLVGVTTVAGTEDLNLLWDRKAALEKAPATGQ